MYAGTYMTDKDRQKSIAQWSASACTRADGVEVKALTRPMIDEIVQAYGHVAGLAKRAGFEMLMIPGGHGGLYAAYTAARRGHQVIFCEKGSEVGGILKGEAALQARDVRAGGHL